MFNNIIKQFNAEEQEPKATENTEAAATTNEPVQETTQTQTEAAPVQEPAPVAEVIEETAHDDFDWSRDKRNVAAYSSEEREKYDNVYDNTFKQINDGEMIMATIESLTKTDAVVNIGFKSDGLISLNEFRDIPGGVKVGDQVEVPVKMA